MNKIILASGSFKRTMSAIKICSIMVNTLKGCVLNRGRCPEFPRPDTLYSIHSTSTISTAIFAVSGSISERRRLHMNDEFTRHAAVGGNDLLQG